MNHKAIYTLYPNVTRVDEEESGTFCYDINDAEVTIDEAAVNAWVDLDVHKFQREAEYPSIGDQLDALFHAGVFPAEMAATIQAVKDKYPKGES
jgi:hypothetical protein